MIDNDLQQFVEATFPAPTSRNRFDDEYSAFLQEILEFGEVRQDRTGTGTKSIFATNMSFNLEDGAFPAITTKKLHWKSVVHELLWFLSGDTNIKYLKDNGVRIWDAWADENGNLGPVYGRQWRHWQGHDGSVTDQISELIHQIKTNPYSRRLVVSAWNVADVKNMALPPCHMFFQFYVREDKYLDLQLYQRSGDAFLGIPFNIASYSLLLMMVAHVTGYKAGWFTHIVGDAHIYTNHFEQVREQLSRESFSAPRVVLNPEIKNIEDFKYEDIDLQNYQHHPAISAKVAV